MTALQKKTLYIIAFEQIFDRKRKELQVQMLELLSLGREYDLFRVSDEFEFLAIAQSKLFSIIKNLPEDDVDKLNFSSEDMHMIFNILIGNSCP
jgi:hypothetical protein